MNARELKSQRLKQAWTQMEAARRLGVSQPYVAMLESGRRRLTPKLLRRLVGAYRLTSVMLPPSEGFDPRTNMRADRLADQLAVLGYPGFEYLRPRVPRKNPGEVLLAALAQDELEARLVEALPWLLLRYWEMNARWLVEQAKKYDLQNRLGFVVNLARRASDRPNLPKDRRSRALLELESVLERSRLAREDGFLRHPRTDAERHWLGRNRPEEARHWNLLTDWRPEHLQYVA